MIFSGVGTDQLAPHDARSLDDVRRAYLEQLHAVQKLNGRVILMASRALARIAKTPDDYLAVYARVLAEAEEPVILHWLGEMFDPALSGYWGGDDFAGTMETCLAVITGSAAKVDGIKISLLDDQKEVTMRRRLPETFSTAESTMRRVAVEISRPIPSPSIKGITGSSGTTNASFSTVMGHPSAGT